MVLPESVGGYSKRLDKALPGKHTRILYDALKRRESDILVQLRTGMTRLNSVKAKTGLIVLLLVLSYMCLRGAQLLI
jgi:hypothetical protein